MRTRKTFFALLMSFWLGIYGLQSVHAASLPIPVVSASLSGTTVKLSYNSTSKVSGYEISLSSDTEALKVIYTGSKTSTSINKLAYGSTLQFTVRSYVLSKKVKTYSDPVSLTVEVKLSAPVLNGKINKSVATLSWAKVTGAQGYELYRSETYAGPYKLIKTAATLKFTEKLGVGIKGYYKIRAYVSVKGKKVYGDFSNIVLISN